MMKKAYLSDLQLNCIGCGACQAAFPDAVHMQIDQHGFYKAVMNQTKIRLSDIERVCPLVYRREQRIAPMWGKYLTVCSGYAVDAALRKTASSGGVISALLIHLLQTGLVEAVIQCGTDENDPLRNRVFINTTMAEVRSCSGSRYAPVCLLENLPSHLDSHESFAFVGRPCDVRAMRNIMAENQTAAEKIRFCLSFFCAGTPSYLATEKILETIGVKKNEVHGIRYRGDGWPGATTVETGDKTYTMTYQQSWGAILGRNTLQFCRICADGTGEDADLSCGDAWKLSPDKKPLFEETDGVNVIVARTGKGLALLKQAQSAGAVCTDEYAPDSLQYAQPFQYMRKGSLSARIRAMRLLGRYVPDYSCDDVEQLRKTLPLPARIRIWLGTAKRCLSGKIQ